MIKHHLIISDTVYYTVTTGNPDAKAHNFYSKSHT